MLNSGTRAIAALALALSLLFARPGNVSAQRSGSRHVELTFLSGYQWGSSLGTAAGDLHLVAGVPFGGILGFRVRPDALVEISYQYLGSSVEIIHRPGAQDTTLGDLAVHRIQIGGMAEKPGGKVRPFGHGTLGMTIFDPASNVGSETQFSAALGAGVKIPSSSGRVGLRLQGNLLMTLFSSGGGFWCSVPGPCAVSFTGTALVQGELLGGIYIVP